MTPATATIAIAAALQESLHPTADRHDRCLATVRWLLKIPALYPTAKAAYEAIPDSERHLHTVPLPGHPVFFRTPNAAWHVTLADTEPWYVWSTDILRYGKLDRVPKSLIQHRWNAPYLGWTDSLNGVTIP